MSDKQVSNGLKSALEFGPVALFFIAYIWLKDEVFQFDGTEYGGFIIVTAERCRKCRFLPLCW